MLHLTDESGTEVDADVFEELLQAGDLTIKVSTEKSTGKTWVKKCGSSTRSSDEHCVGLNVFVYQSSLSVSVSLLCPPVIDSLVVKPKRSC